MIESNVRIIAELKQVLNVVAHNPELRKLFTQCETDFTRNRKLTLENIVAFIINMPKRSLSVELYDFFSMLGDTKTATKSAFSQQRIKLLPLFFQFWNRYFVNAFYEEYGTNIKRWNGFRLLAVDGSTVYLIDTPEIVEKFGLQKEIPMARVMQIHDVLNDIAVWGDLFPIRKSEKAIIGDRVESLYKDSLTVFDRGFPSYWLMFMMINQETPRHFVMRCKLDFSKVIRAFVKSEIMSQTIEITPSYKSKNKLKEKGFLITAATTIKIRMIKVILSSGEVEVLLTNLYDETIYPIECFSQLYFLRWGIETSYGMQKNQQQMEQFSGHRTQCILQDYYAGIFTLNLQSLVEKQCQPFLENMNRTRKYNYKINKNISRSNIKYNIVKLFLWNNPEKILLKMQKMFELYIEPERPGRHNARINKATKINGKYQTLTNYKRCI